MEKNTLGGFETILDAVLPFDGDNRKPGLNDDFGSEELTDEELEEIRKQGTGSGSKVNDDDIDDNDSDETEKDVTPAKKTKKVKKIEEDEDDDDDNIIVNDSKGNDRDGVDDIDDNESEAITNFFDALAEKIGWEDIEEDEKPKTTEELIEYFNNVIEENSKPDYASEEVEALDAFVRQGGNLRDYFEIDKQIDFDDLDLEDEATQKAVVKQLLKEKGFSGKQIEKKLAKYEDAGILEDEANDAVEDLKEIMEERKQQLLKDQEKQFREAQAKQQKLYNDVVSNIKGLETIRGIKVPEKDKRALIDYILKPDTDGQTRYYKDYVKGGVKSLIESAYFTMNADKLISAAESKGRTKAVDKFRNSLKSPSVSTKSRRQVFNDDDNSIWSSVTRSLRMS